MADASWNFTLKYRWDLLYNKVDVIKITIYKKKTDKELHLGMFY